MSRSGYVDYLDEPGLNLWRVCPDCNYTWLKGKRGQAFLLEMLHALDALPEKRLISEHLVVKESQGARPEECGVCAIGSVGVQRGIDMQGIENDDPKAVGSAFGIACAMAAEIEFINDDDFGLGIREEPEARFTRVRSWVCSEMTPATREEYENGN